MQCNSLCAYLSPRSIGSPLRDRASNLLDAINYALYVINEAHSGITTPLTAYHRGIRLVVTSGYDDARLRHHPRNLLVNPRNDNPPHFRVKARHGLPFPPASVTQSTPPQDGPITDFDRYLFDCESANRDERERGGGVGFIPLSWDNRIERDQLADLITSAIF